jgi:hypothetical protein
MKPIANVLFFTILTASGANPDHSSQPSGQSHESGAFQPYSTQDQQPDNEVTDATPSPETEPNPDVVPQNEQEAPEGQVSLGKCGTVDARCSY